MKLTLAVVCRAFEKKKKTGVKTWCYCSFCIKIQKKTFDILINDDWRPIQFGKCCEVTNDVNALSEIRKSECMEFDQNIFNISLLKLDTLTETALEQGHEVHWQPTTWLVFTAPTPQPETRLGLRSESSHNISLFPSVIPVSWKLKNQKPLPSEFSQRRSWTLVPQEIEIFQVCEPLISASGHIKKKTQILANKTAGNLRFLDKRNNDQISW